MSLSNDVLPYQWKTANITPVHKKGPKEELSNYRSSGVPQGSVLGQKLFLIYINDLPWAVSSNVSLYADDTLLYSKVSSNQEKQLFQMNINALHDWSTKWKMPKGTRMY